MLGAIYSLFTEWFGKEPVTAPRCLFSLLWLVNWNCRVYTLHFCSFMLKLDSMTVKKHIALHTVKLPPPLLLIWYMKYCFVWKQVCLGSLRVYCKSCDMELSPHGYSKPLFCSYLYSFHYNIIFMLPFQRSTSPSLG